MTMQASVTKKEQLSETRHQQVITPASMVKSFDLNQPASEHAQPFGPSALLLEAFAASAAAVRADGETRFSCKLAEPLQELVPVGGGLSVSPAKNGVVRGSSTVATNASEAHQTVSPSVVGTGIGVSAARTATKSNDIAETSSVESSTETSSVEGSTFIDVAETSSVESSTETSCDQLEHHYSGSNAVEKWELSFPNPGTIEGVKSRKTVIFKMDMVGFTYPEKDNPALLGVSLTLSRNSRTLVTGVEGAGKSTLGKLLVGELMPTDGTISRVKGLRMSYVSQNPFDDLNYHGPKTPMQYMMWQFAEHGATKPSELKPGRLSVDAPEQMTQVDVENYLADFGLNPESTSGKQISELSCSAKIKLVLAAALWQKPHILIFDEPTNYLDNEGLVALIRAIDHYKGGVLILAHRDVQAFQESCAAEKRSIRGGRLHEALR